MGKENDREKCALKVLHGDFAGLSFAAGGSPADRAKAALRAADAWNGYGRGELPGGICRPGTVRWIRIGGCRRAT